MKSADLPPYDSMRYELGVDAGYTFTYAKIRRRPCTSNWLTLYDDSNNDADVNGDSTDNGVEVLRYVLVWVLSSASRRTSAPTPMLTTRRR